jgi:KipI family sensor histidine kinase inhibitor
VTRATIEPLGEDALLLRLGRCIDADVNARVHALARRLLAEAPAWLEEVVPAFASLAVRLREEATGDADRLHEAREWLSRLLDIPVCYAPAFAPDLGALAAHAGLAPEEVVARHAAGDYRVAMLGFAPGFPYLLGLDPALAMPRMDTPRLLVPAGSVAIGGAQTGIYPQDSPGGWRIIGRTPLRLFDATRDLHCLLAPGQRVRFVPVDEARFAELAEREDAR